MALVTGQNDGHYHARTIMRVSKRTYCFSDDSIITSFVVSKLPDLLRKFFSSPYFLSIVSVIHVYIHEAVTEGETW